MYSTGRGFTLVELLIAIVVIAILAAISVVAYNGIQDRAKATRIVSDIKATEKAFRLYKTSSGASRWWLENDATLLAGGSATIFSIINNNSEFRNFLQAEPSRDGLDTTYRWSYENDGDTYNGCSRASTGVNLILSGVNNHDLMLRVDEMIDDGDPECGKLHLHPTNDQAYLYTMSNNSNS